MNIQQGPGEGDDAQDVGEGVPDAREDKALDRRHVAGEPGDQVTERPALEEIKRQALQMVKQARSQGQDKLSPYPARKVAIAVPDCPGQQRQSNVAERDPPERPEIAGDEHLVHDDLEQPDPGRIDGRRHHNEGKGQPEEPAVRLGVGPEARENFP